MDAALHGCHGRLQSVMVRELGKGAELRFAASPVLLVQIVPEDCWRLLADAAVLPGTGILHQGAECRAVVIAVRALRSEFPFVGDQQRAVILQDIHLVGIDANEDALVAVLRPGRVIMLPIQADLPVTVRLEPFVAAYMECFPWQRT